MEIVSPNPRQQLIKLFPNYRSARGVEVGVQEGKFSAQILEGTLGKLYMVDSWRYFEGYDDIANVTDGEHSAKMLSALQLTEEFKSRRCVINELSVEAAKIFPDEFFDWIYIDAAHDTASVIADLEAWLPKLKLGGIMSGDDYFEGREFNSDFGVISGIDKFFWVHPELKKDLKVLAHAQGTPQYCMPQWYFCKELV